ncbi:MAG: sensor histidine kinase KdpD, partial [Acidobacteriota bacterium]
MAEIILEKKPEQARLRIYIGAAPGVGKTYQMLDDAYLMKHQQGIDVVIGLMES